MQDIPNYHTFKSITPISKGWSGDKKYYVEAEAGEKYLLRISDITDYGKKQIEFDNMKKIATAGISMSQPIDFGICNEGRSVYQLLSWCEGEEAKELLFDMSEAEQYNYGHKAADILKRMELVERRQPSQAWRDSYKKRVFGYIERYRNCGVTFQDDDIIINFLQTQIDCIGERPTALMHEDFQTDNMVINPNGELFVIDFQMCGMIDPWLSLSGVSVSAMSSVPFANGQIDGYFGKNVPIEFWNMNHYYLIAEMLYAFTVAVTMEQEKDEAPYMFIDEVKRIKNNKSFVPEWYEKKPNSSFANKCNSEK